MSAVDVGPDYPVLHLGPVSLRAPGIKPRQVEGRSGHLWQWTGDGSPLLTLLVAVRETRLRTATAAERTLGSEIERVRDGYDPDTAVQVRHVRDVQVEGAVASAAATVAGVLDGMAVRNGLVVTTDGPHVHLVRLAVADTDEGKALLGHVLDDLHVHDWVRPR